MGMMSKILLENNLKKMMCKPSTHKKKLLKEIEEDLKHQRIYHVHRL